MRTKLIYGIFLCLIAIFVLSQTFYKNTLAKDKITWEYLSIGAYASDNDFVTKCNKLGNEGWELVAIQQANEQGSNSYYVFKRAK